MAVILPKGAGTYSIPGKPIKPYLYTSGERVNISAEQEGIITEYIMEKVENMEIWKGLVKITPLRDTFGGDIIAIMPMAVTPGAKDISMPPIGTQIMFKYPGTGDDCYNNNQSVFVVTTCYGIGLANSDGEKNTLFKFQQHNLPKILPGERYLSSGVGDNESEIFMKKDGTLSFTSKNTNTTYFFNQNQNIKGVMGHQLAIREKSGSYYNRDVDVQGNISQKSSNVDLYATNIVENITGSMQTILNSLEMLANDSVNIRTKKLIMSAASTIQMRCNSLFQTIYGQLNISADDITIECSGNHTRNVKGDVMETVNGDMMETIDGDINFDVAGNILIGSGADHGNNKVIRNCDLQNIMYICPMVGLIKFNIQNAPDVGSTTVAVKD